MGTIPIDAIEVATSGRPAQEVLAWSRAMVVPAMRDAVDSLPGSMRHIAGYHLGWWDADGSVANSAGGKSIRPALVLLCANAVGGASADAVPAAVAVELVHNFSLLHDDVMDRDETRRHRPTAWRVFGMGDAILAGDALVTLALQLLATGCGDTGEQTATLCAAVQALIDGQHADLAFEARDDVRLSECVHMAEGKTGALIRAACALGALAGGAGSDQVEQLAQFGASLGLAFQVVDDLAGLWGDPEVTGKPAHSDLRNRKKSLPVVAALESGTASGQELAAWFAGSSEPTETELARAATLVEEAGGGAWSQTQVDLLRSRALRFLGFAGPSPLAAAELSALGEHIVGPPARAGR